MATRVALKHVTTYDFDRPVVTSPHVVRLRPAPHTRTVITAYSLAVEPEQHFIHWQQDPFGNYQARLVFPEPASRLRFTVDLVVELSPVNPFDFFLDIDAEKFPFSYDPPLAQDLAPYLDTCSAGSGLGAYLSRLRTTCLEVKATRTIDALALINQRLAADIAYTERFESGVQTPEATLELARGSCRDSAWLLVQVLRHLGLAARFVSGYLVQLAPEATPDHRPTDSAEDASDLHAWTEVFLPGAGWIGLDPTSGLFAAEGHIPLSATPSPTSAAPISGTTSPAEVTFSFSNTVERVPHTLDLSRPTMP